MKPDAEFRERVHAAAKRHPIITLSTLAVLVSIVGGVWPLVMMVADRFETRAHAEQVEANLRRDLAWQTVQALRMEVTVSRNRVNDCDIADQKRDTMSLLERAACAQYRAELVDATRRYDEVRRVAREASK